MSIDIDTVHSWIIKQLLEKRVMTQHFVSTNKEVYPVIIGGVNVVRCSNLQPKTRELVGNIYKNDIDTKFVITKPISDLKDPLNDQAHEQRMKFVNSLLSSDKFTNLLKDAEAQTQNRVTITAAVQDQRQHNIEEIRRVQRIVVRLEYRLTQEVISEEVVIRKDLIDSGVLSRIVMGDHYDAYNRLFPSSKSKLPIPHVKFRGLPVANCVWTYFDTVRMLANSGREWEALVNDPKAKPGFKQFTFKKYVKYLAKFAILYLTMSKINKDPEYQLIKAIYKTSQEHISKIKYTKKDAEITNEQKQLLNTLVSLIRGKTNFKKIKHVLQSKSPVIKL